jgi:hypothetical protein
VLEDDKGDPFEDFIRILKRWKKHFYQLLNCLRLMMLGLTKCITAEPLICRLGTFEYEMAIEGLKRYKTPDTDQVQA